MKITLIRDRANLEGTAYYEFSPGVYDESHWRAESVFINHQVFDVLEAAVSSALDAFNPYGPTTVPPPKIGRLCRALADLGERVGQARSGEDAFGSQWEALPEELRSLPWSTLKNDVTRLTGDLVRWLRRNAHYGQQVTIPGL